MIRIATLADKRAAEDEMAVEDRWDARSLYQQLNLTAERFSDRPALAFQLLSTPGSKALRLTWSGFRQEVTRAANLFRGLGVGPQDTVAYVLPNGIEAPVVLVAGATAGIVMPVNPLLSPAHMAGILRDANAKVVVTLAPFPKSDLAQTVAEAVAVSPQVEVVLQVDLRRYLAPPKSWIAPLLRPKVSASHRARVLDFAMEMKRQGSDRLDFDETLDDRICATFHTGGTTGMPKIARHRASGILYNGWCGHAYMFTEADVMLCPLPMFHIFAAYPVFVSCLMSGAQMVMVTPQGYRGEGVFENFWKLIERWRVTFLITVPTAAAKLMQVPVNADVSTLRYAICGSAALPVKLFQRFEAATGVRILEGYGMTEATCLISINPPHGTRKIGSVGLPFPYTAIRIARGDTGGAGVEDCDPDEVGEICVLNPGVGQDIYADPDQNRNALTPDGYLRTGDLGRIDPEGFLWITGRAKDLIIRGGHNIDPAFIEEALARHPAVAFAGAIGQPDAHSGEVPAAYVELIAGAEVSPQDLKSFLSGALAERAAMPKHFEVLPELPKTAVGKVFKPDLRRRAIARVYNQALSEAGCQTRVVEVVEDKGRGLVAVLAPRTGDDKATAATLGSYLTPWRWEDAEGPRS